MIRTVLAAAALHLVAGCGGQAGPPLEISDVDVYAPLPGSSVSVAYMTLANNTGEDIVVTGFSSPEFASVELHETFVTGGVSRMRALAELSVPARSVAVLEEGGRHLMLMQPESELALNQPVSVEVSYDTQGLVIVRATLRSRVVLDETR